VLASILVEALLSAISGVIVFVLSLAWVHGVNAPLPLLIAFALSCSLALHPKVFRPVSRKLLKPFGASVEPLPFELMLLLLLFYAATWVIGGCGLYALLRAVGANPGLVTIPFLAASRRSARSSQCSPCSRLRARSPGSVDVRLAARSRRPGPALSAALLNRLVITIVELALFAVGVVSWRGVRRAAAERP
jgi:hypothetical protein